MTSVLVDPLIRSDAGPDARSDVPADVWAVDRAMDVVNGRLAELAGQLNVVNARLVEVTETVLVDELWRQGGMRTPSAFLQWRLGVSSVRANDLVTVARRRGEFPVLMGCFERGEFSLEQMAAAVAAPAWADGLIVDFVRISTPSKIRRAMRSDMFTDVPAASDATDDVSGSAPVDRSRSLRRVAGGSTASSDSMMVAGSKRRCPSVVTLSSSTASPVSRGWKRSSTVWNVPSTRSSRRRVGIGSGRGFTSM